MPSERVAPLSSLSPRPQLAGPPAPGPARPEPAPEGPADVLAALWGELLGRIGRGQFVAHVPPRPDAAAAAPDAPAACRRRGPKPKRD